MQINDIILECVKRKIPVDLRWHSELHTLVYDIHGFCKSSKATAYESSHDLKKHLVVSTRYGQVDHIESFAGLADLAFEWWKKSDRTSWHLPHESWRDTFKEMGFVRPSVVEGYRNERIN